MKMLENCSLLLSRIRRTELNTENHLTQQPTTRSAVLQMRFGITLRLRRQT